MDRDDVLRLQYFREYICEHHLSRIWSIEDYFSRSPEERRDLHVSSVKLSLRDELWLENINSI